MNDMDRPACDGLFGHRDHHAIGHHGRVQRDHRVVADIVLSRSARASLPPSSSTSRTVCTRTPASSAGQIGQLGRKTPSTSTSRGRRPSHARQARLRPASAPPHPAQPPAAAPRASARAGRYISSPRSADAAGRRARRPRTPAGASSATLPVPGSRSRATVNASLSARPVFGFCQCNVHHQIRL